MELAESRARCSDHPVFRYATYGLRDYGMVINVFLDCVDWAYK
jgi:hypothetical protein